jgi:CheY-like chemotaxis protein
MKRILVLDDSDAVRETVALLLARDCSVETRAVGAQSLALATLEPKLDLVIYGVPRAMHSQWQRLVSEARRAPCPVLFIVDAPPAPGA